MYIYIYVYIFSSSKKGCTKTCRITTVPKMLVPTTIPSSRLLLFDELPPVPPLPLNVDHMQLGHNEKWFLQQRMWLMVEVLMVDTFQFEAGWILHVAW